MTTKKTTLEHKAIEDNTPTPDMVTSDTDTPISEQAIFTDDTTQNTTDKILDTSTALADETVGDDSIKDATAKTHDTLSSEEEMAVANESAASEDNKSQKAQTIEEEKHALPSQIKLSGRMLNFTRLHIQGNDVSDILQKVEKKLGKQRQTKLPVVVSCEHKLELASLWQGLWQLGLQPIGIVTGVLDEQATAMPVAIFPTDGQRIDGKAVKKPMDTVLASNDNSAKSHSNQQPDADLTENDITHDKFSIATDTISHVEGDLVHTQMLRSGQSINHVGGDLVLTRGINAGAEAITDYNLHIYGKAEGRLVAGATGDKNAKIFCLRFNPSLVSVAGTYCLRENIPAGLLNKAVQVSFVEGQGLVFELMEL